jgi:hypothetical protein
MESVKLGTELAAARISPAVDVKNATIVCDVVRPLLTFVLLIKHAKPNSHRQYSV